MRGAAIVASAAPAVGMTVANITRSSHRAQRMSKQVPVSDDALVDESDEGRLGHVVDDVAFLRLAIVNAVRPVRNGGLSSMLESPALLVASAAQPPSGLATTLLRKRSSSRTDTSITLAG